ncbi:MAG: type 1 glutamine amidotransferase [bacterium]|nr:MAG: type 1 glutamine amidotransferase [bacterium]
MRLRDRRVGILVETLYQDQELWYPYYRMMEEGAEVVVVGPRVDTFTSKYGYPAKADAAAGDVAAEDLDALIIPGGYAPDHMRRHKAMVDLVAEMDRQGKVVAAICHAGWMLASAGILEGRTVTGFFAIRDDMVNAGARWVDREVAVDRNLITSRQPSDLPAFCRAVIEALT